MRFLDEALGQKAFAEDVTRESVASGSNDSRLARAGAAASVTVRSESEFVEVMRVK